ncbi:MAG: cytidine deaminase, partial [Erysipelotrichaceae bacterium]|nr:cytidine deaminase [Erysipelotrichaceae bacterium]
MSNEELIALALEAREGAYAPYSNWKVGAALLCRDGRIFKGCNIENSGFSATVCAERTAFFKAVSEGERDFVKIAIIAGDAQRGSEGYCTP